MLFRVMVVFLLFLSTVVRVSATSLYPLDDPSLLKSADELRKKNYAGAKQIALEARDSTERNFLLGVSFYRLEKWEEAAEALSKTAESFLLADYSLYYRAGSLIHLKRYDEAIEALKKLKKGHPSSPLIAEASYLHADALFLKGDHAAALPAYLKYVESYPAGARSLKAALQAAMCREALGDKEKAVCELRAIWLKYPGSGVSALAEENLERLSSENVPVPPYTSEETFRRGMILYDLHKYRDALETFRSINEDTLSENLRPRLALKTGLTLFKLRRYKEAEQVMSSLRSIKDREIACEASYWLARTQDRSGRKDQAAACYVKIAENHPVSELADDALFWSALIKKDKGEHIQAAEILERLVSEHPSSILAPNALWEGAWNRYLAKDFKRASDSFTRLLDNRSYREKALYWLAKSHEASGENERANEFLAMLAKEYPYGFYALHGWNGTGINDSRFPVTDVGSACLIPIPAGYDRVKALITFGLSDEAGKELAVCRKRASGRNGILEIARLYWEIPDYRSAMALFENVNWKSAPAWTFSYPTAFSEHVSRHAENNRVPESLAYSIIRAESSFKPSAHSPAGAVGLMQLMPATAKFLHNGKSGKIDNSLLTRPDLNISLGMKHIKDLIKRYDGNLVLAVAAYNSGATPVDRWRRSFPALRRDEFIENIPYPETREYVKKVLTSMAIYKSLYGLDARPEETGTPTPAQVSPTPGLAVSSTDAKEVAGKN